MFPREIFRGEEYKDYMYTKLLIYFTEPSGSEGIGMEIKNDKRLNDDVKIGIVIL